MIQLVLAIALGIVLAYLIITNLAVIGYILLAIIVLAILYGIFSFILSDLVLKMVLMIELMN